VHEFVDAFDLLVVDKLVLKFFDIRCKLVFNQSVLEIIQRVAFEEGFNIKNLAAHEHGPRRV
jgi:hypothetical protein